jgi:F-type H+-transporting ATPase subunit delta
VSVAGTYAEALYEAAVDQGAVAEVSAGLDAFMRALDDSGELRQFLLAPEIDTERKKAALAELLAEASPLVVNFLLVLLDRGRAPELPEIAAAYAERVALAEGRISVEAITAVPLPDDLRQRVIERVAAQTEREVELTESVDPSIVGGLVLRAGGLLVDASVRLQLDELERSLASAPVETAS